MPFAAHPSTGSVPSLLPDSRPPRGFSVRQKTSGDIKHFTLSQGDDEVDYLGLHVDRSQSFSISYLTVKLARLGCM